MDSPAPHECFQHQPLDLTENSFRLLYIEGISREGLVECTIKIHNRDKTGTWYTALSYAWGPEQPTYWILLNGKPFRVRKNLAQFLRSAVSHHGWVCRIWIDAICIDQGNNLERAHQVMQMASIYRDAAVVLVWLGQPERDYIELQSTSSDIMRKAEGSRSKYDLNWVHGLDPELYDEDHPLFHQLQDLLMREYWNRMWIIQEVVHGRDTAILLCGQYQFHWGGIIMLGKLWDNYWQKDEIGMAMRLVRMSSLGKWGFSFTTVLQLLVSFDGGGACADVRDKVYSLLGLLRDPGNLRPDYSISAECLFFRVLQNEIRSSKRGHVVLGDASILKRSLGLNLTELGGHLRNAKDMGAHREESIWLGREPSLLQPNKESIYPFVWKRVLRSGLECHFDHDKSVGATTWLLNRRDILFEFASFGPEDQFRKAMILREFGPGVFKYIAMAEYQHINVPDSEASDRCWTNERWFLYHLPALLSADCFVGKDDRIRVSSEVFLVLMKLSELGMSIGNPRVDENDLKVLGIRDGLVITHTTLFKRIKLKETREACDYDSIDRDVVRLEIPTHEIYDGYSGLWR